MGVSYKQLSGKPEFYENCLSDSHTLFWGINKFFSHAFHIYWLIWVKFAIEDLHVMPFYNCNSTFTWDILLPYNKYNGKIRIVNHNYVCILYCVIYYNIFGLFLNQSSSIVKYIKRDCHMQHNKVFLSSWFHVVEISASPSHWKTG